MAKKAKKIEEVQEVQKTEKVDSMELIKAWVENHACDRSSIRMVDKDKFRVNLYVESGEVIRITRLSRSFYLVVTNGVIEDKTIKST